MDEIGEIAAYLLFLRQSGLQVTLHPMEFDPVITPSELHRFNLHENPYCIYLKTYPALWRHCVDKQQCVWKKSRQGAFCGTCFAGVREYVYPIRTAARVVGFISVSGYAAAHPDSYIDRTAARYHLDRALMKQAYAQLRPLPPREEVDVLLRPLCRMLELCYRKASPETAAAAGLCERLLYYLQVNHTRRITIDEICGAFYSSRSSISHKFKDYTGQTITQYLHALRIEDAKSLLSGTQLSVSTISGAVGFDNSNYFTNVFTKATGLSPTAYRKQAKG